MNRELSFYMCAGMAALLAVALAGCTSTTKWERATAEYRPNLAGLKLPGGTPVTPTELLDAGARKHGARGDQSTVKPAPRNAAPDVKPREATTTNGSKERTLEIGDGVSISLHAIELVTLDEIVDERGNATLPYIGSARLAGLTPAAAEEHVWRTYVEEKKIFKETLVVTIIPSARTFYIKGEVNRPAPYPLRPGLTLTKAVATSGGPTVWANTKKIRIRKEGGSTTAHNLEKIEDGKARDPVVEPGDIIEVPRRWY